MDKRIAIGIDPGVKGGIVILADVWQPEPEAIGEYTNNTLGRYDLRNLLNRLIDSAINQHHCNIYACIEKVGGFIGEETPTGKRNIASAHSTFVLGHSYGKLEMALVCARISFTEVMPAVWQKSVGMTGRKKGEKVSKWKYRLWERAKELFPEREITKELADAYLIAHYCRSLKTW